MVRIKCSSCESTRGISYCELEGSNGAVKAESCDECNSYLKLFYMEKDHRVEPVADDLASLALDVLMDETGRARGGPNLFFIRAASESGIQVLSRNIVTPARCSH